MVEQPAGEPVAEAEVKEEVLAAPVVEGEVPAVEEEEVSSLDQLFALRPEVLEFVSTDEDESEDDADKKKKKKKKKFVEIEYDPDRDVLVSRKKHKKGEVWDEEW